MQGDVAGLHHALGRDGEILAALRLATAIDRCAVPLGPLGGVGAADGAAMRANALIGPADAFEQFAGRVVAVEVRSRKSVDHVGCRKLE